MSKKEYTIIESQRSYPKGEPIQENIYAYYWQGKEKKVDIFEYTLDHDYFYISVNDIPDKRKQVDSLFKIDFKHKYLAINGEVCHRVYLVSKLVKYDYERVLSKFKMTFESDVKPVMRWLSKNDIKYSKNIRIGNIDIECIRAKDGSYSKPNEAEAPIVLITVYDNFESAYHVFCYKEVSEILYSKKKKVKVYVFKDEEQMLNQFLKFMIKFQFDYLVGWLINNYDIPYIINRMIFYKINYKKLSPTNNVFCQFNAQYYTYKQANFSLSIGGVGIIDFLTTAKKFKLGAECGYKLDSMAKFHLKDIRKESIGDIDLAYKNNFNKLVSYNITDVEIVNLLDEKLELIKKLQSFQEMVAINLDKTLVQGNIIEGFILKNSSVVLFNRSEKESNSINEQAEGGKVLQSKPGTYNNVYKFDFKSQYPSTIITYNIDPSKIIYDIKKYKGKYISMDNKYFFKNNGDGELIRLIKILYENRFKYKRSNTGLSVAYKENMNSFYGQLLAPFSRIYNMKCGEAVTYQGRRCIGLIEKMASEKFKGEIILGDTDSIIFNSFDKNFSPEKFIKEVVKVFNEMYKKDKVTKNKYISLAFENKIDKLIIFGNEEGKGIKKKYIEYVKGSKPKYVGMDLIKADTQEIAKDMQKEVSDYFIYNDIVTKDGMVDIIEKYKIKFSDSIRSKEYDYVAIPSKLNKDASKYKGEPIMLKAIENSGIKIYAGDSFYILVTDLGPVGYKTNTDLNNIPEKFEIDKSYLWERALKKVEMFYWLLGEKLVIRGKTKKQYLHNKKILAESVIPLFEQNPEFYE